jgi:hypothetical protein
MQQLDFSYTFRFKIAKIKCLFLTKSGKFIILTPEEWVHNMSFGFITGKKYPKSLIGKKVLKVNGLRKDMMS